MPSSPAGKASPESTPKKQNRKGFKGGAGGKDANANSATKGHKGRASSAPNRRATTYDAHNCDTFGGGEDHVDGRRSEAERNDGWGFEAMLAANERITGKTFVYDGNPHEFGDPALAARESGAPGAAAATPAPAPLSHVREEDKVGYLKPRTASLASNGVTTQQHGQRSRSPVPAAAVAKKSSGREPATAKVAAGGSGRKGAKGGKTGAHASAGKPGAGVGGGGGAGVGSSGSVAGVATVVGGVEGFGTRVLVTESARRRQVATGLCTEGAVSTGGAVGGSALWVNGAGTSGGGGAVTESSGGGGLFGEFKFDMLDIMNAVPQG